MSISSNQLYLQTNSNPNSKSIKANQQHREATTKRGRLDQIPSPQNEVTTYLKGQSMNVEEPLDSWCDNNHDNVPR